MQVKEIMTAPVICAPADASIADVALLLARHEISAVPVTDESGSVVGLISEYDLLARKGKLARDIMSPGIISVNEETDVEEVRYLLIERRIRRVPVLAGQQLVGIVSRSDLIRQMAVQWYCDICGEPVRDEHPPEQCPKCRAPAARFAQDDRPPGD
ncbi:MAG: CBS domain-containing protein [Chloroflexota bacterium]